MNQFEFSTGNKPKNPCIGYCQLNEDDVCKGCGRTKDERTDWIFLSDDEKRKVVGDAKVRLAAIKEAE
ncbi:hypothetical protein DS2_18920 [Catenovulum agarivorans DS-2]|uniref:Fe-S protein n=1 Tax=Catenovulum agarivorans DS-2 TaxID=1328313 RepID=W7QGS8_9ALTE|nr:DUF1289 domain-containing protein [Catenovulum agarivorans]EWH08137.1 hypothetical protein DS2_18920 [Catenovulum agarivorans DS-2]